MEIYLYKGRNKRGDLMEGTIEAPNTDGVVSWMLASGLSPVDIRPKVSTKAGASWLTGDLFGRGKVSSEEVLLLTRQLGTLIKAGVPLIQAVESLRTTSTSPALVELMKRLQTDLDRGLELSTALAQHPTVFGDYYINMIRVGEAAGQLDEVFARLFAQLDFDRQMGKKLKGVMRYPTFVGIAVVGALVVMMMFVVPAFAGIFANSKMELPVFTKILIGLSDFMVQRWYVVFGAAGAVGYVVKRYLESPEGKYRWDKRKLSLPVIGGIMRKASTARFCRSLATALKSGVPVVTALTLVSKVADNLYYEERIIAIREAVSRGESLFRGFLAAGVFTPVEVQMVSIGEQTGDVEGMINNLAVLYQEEVEFDASKMAETIEPIMLVFMAGLIMVLLLGIFLPMWNMARMAM